MKERASAALSDGRYLSTLGSVRRSFNIEPSKEAPFSCCQPALVSFAYAGLHCVSTAHGHARRMTVAKTLWWPSTTLCIQAVLIGPLQRHPDTTQLALLHCRPGLI